MYILRANAHVAYTYIIFTAKLLQNLINYCSEIFRLKLLANERIVRTLISNKFRFPVKILINIIKILTYIIRKVNPQQKRQIQGHILIS